jgi:hypothetical protein
MILKKKFYPNAEIEPIAEAAEQELSSFSQMCADAQVNSQKYLAREKQEIGGNPLPWEPGGEKYFHRGEVPPPKKEDFIFEDH